jgi:hypothetical protein
MMIIMMTSSTISTRMIIAVPMITMIASSSTSTCWLIIDMPIIGFTAIIARRSRTGTYI